MRVSYPQGPGQGRTVLKDQVLRHVHQEIALSETIMNALSVGEKVILLGIALITGIGLRHHSSVNQSL